ncbi:MAG: alanine--tRNA ligase, partial [Candidatus Diapherotrites archaeon]|nr:alanine--tRNA ligase [Candidatus Diapherotrites archaeon]
VFGILPTEKDVYNDVNEFDANVVASITWKGKKWYALDKTAFYPESGGQDYDTGWLQGFRVNSVQKVGDVVLHQVDEALPKRVHGKIDWQRRKALAKHHTATHLINGAARRVLGEHVWQAGARKEADKAHLDITHYDSLSDEQVLEIEELSNKVVRENRGVTSVEMPRVEAEKKYGFRLYQGGAVPERILRIVEVKDWDVEACGGTHLKNTADAEIVTIIGTEKIQDGVVRITFAASDAAKQYLSTMYHALEETSELLMCSNDDVPEAVNGLMEQWKEKKKRVEVLRKQRAEEMPVEFERFGKWEAVISTIPRANLPQLRAISKRLSDEKRFLFLVGVLDKVYVFCSAGDEYVKQGVNAGEIVSELCRKLGGGGGGPPQKGEGVIPLESKPRIDELMSDVRKRLGARVRNIAS